MLRSIRGYQARGSQHISLRSIACFARHGGNTGLANVSTTYFAEIHTWIAQRTSVLTCMNVLVGWVHRSMIMAIIIFRINTMLFAMTANVVPGIPYFLLFRSFMNAGCPCGFTTRT